MPKFDSGFLAMLLVASADLFALGICHQRQVNRGRQAPACKFDGRSCIDERRICEQQALQVVNLDSCRLTLIMGPDWVARL